MTNKSISQLTAGGAVASTDLFPDVQTAGVGPVKVTAAQIGDYVLSGSGLTNVLPVSRGGTGLSTLTAANYALYSTSASALTAGTLPVAAGGTGLTSLTTGYIPYGNGTGAFSSSAGLSYNGTQFFIGGTSSSYIYLTAGGTSYGLLYADNSRTQLEALQSLPLTLWTGGSERMRLDTSGNLGLGVTPSAWSSSYGTIQGAFGTWAISTTGADNNTFDMLSNAYRTGASSYAYYAASTATRYQQANGKHVFYSAASGTAGSAISFTQAMTLDASGNLGLGVTPSAWSSGGWIELNSTGVSSKGTLYSAGNTYYNGGWKYSTTAAASLYVQAAGANIWYTAPSGTAGTAISFTQAMTLDASGNLGIGTSSPGQKLDVVGNLLLSGQSTADQFIRIGSGRTGNGYSFIDLQTDTTYSSGLRIIRLNSGANSNSNIEHSGTGSLGLYTQQAGAITFTTNATGGGGERVRIDSSGNLLVGTTSSVGRLVVQGSDSTSSNYAFRVYDSSSTGLMYVRNDGAYFGGLATLSPYNATTATGANAVFASDGFFYRSTSSRRYKKNIVDAVHGLAELLRLRSVTYNGINDGDQIFGGLIAEEVDAAGLTEFVLYDSDGRPDALHYGNMAGLFVKAIQELAAKVTALEAANG